MKKLSILIVLGLLMAVFATSAYAVASLNVPAVLIGGENQERTTNVSKSITVTNNGTETLTNLVFSTSAAASYNIVFSPASYASLAPGATFNLAVQGDIPLSLDAVDNGLNLISVSIGTITITNGSYSANSALSMQAENALEIDKVYITINGENTEKVTDNDNVKDLKPGDVLDIEIIVENKFDDNDYDVTVDDVEVLIEINDNDFDVDEDEDVGDIDAEDDETANFDDIDVDWEADGDYDLEIAVLGRDENGALHGEKWEVELQVEREKHEIMIKKLTLSDSKLSCNDDSTDVKITVLNIGKKNEDEVAIEVVVEDLDLVAFKEDIELDQDDAATYTLQLDIPEGTAAGVYDIDVYAYWNTDIETDYETISFSMDACEETITSTVTSATAGTAATTSGVAPTVRVTERSAFKESNSYLYLLSAAVIVLLGGVIYLGIRVWTPSK